MPNLGLCGKGRSYKGYSGNLKKYQGYSAKHFSEIISPESWTKVLKICCHIHLFLVFVENFAFILVVKFPVVLTLVHVVCDPDLTSGVYRTCAHHEK